MPWKPKDIIGKQFFRLTVIELLPKDGHARKWLCRCECGNSSTPTTGDLNSGSTKSCGCYHSDSVRERKTTHNLSTKRDKAGHYMYGLWSNMRNRCNNPSGDKFKYYGGRGVKVCKRWDDFSVFLSDMGEKPEGHTMDRIDPDKGYSPENCRWANKSTQARNKTKQIISIEGIKRPFKDWAEHFGINILTCYTRVDRGWCKKCACSIPARGAGCTHKKIPKLSH